MAVAGGPEQRVCELEREHRRLVDDHEVVIVRERLVLVPLEAAVERRVGERAVDRHCVVPCEVAHAPRRLPGGRAEQDAFPRAPCDLDKHALRVRLTGARQSGQEDERSRANELDHAPLLVGDRDVGAARLLEELGVACAGARAERRSETGFHLPELDPVDAVLIDDEPSRTHERPDRGLERLGIGDLQDAAGVLPELAEEQEGVAVGLGVLQHEAHARFEPVRVVELDAERARDPVGDLEPDARQVGEPVRIAREDVHHVVAVLADQSSGEPAADSVGEEKRLDLADGCELTPRRDGPRDALPRHRPARPRSNLAEPFGVAVELLEDVFGSEVPHDRARVDGPDARHAARQPERDPFLGSWQRRVERGDDELPAVLRMLEKRACADELLAGSDLSERAGEPDRVASLPLAHGRRPDRKRGVVGDVARA